MLLSILKLFGKKYYNKLNNTLVNCDDTLNFIKYYEKEEFEIINVGVYHGTEWLIKKFPNSFHHLFEPIKEYNVFINENYKSLKYQIYNFALSNKNSSSNINLNESGSTMHKYSNLTSVFGKKFSKKKINVKKFDDVFKTEKKKKYFMKIDTEGHELNVLKGARNNLKNIDYVLTETRMVPCYQDKTYDFEEILEEMKRNDFKFGLLAEVGSPYKKIYRYVDILWVKNNKYKKFIENVVKFQNNIS